MDTLPTDIVSKLCIETYTEEEIEVAKRLVFDTCNPDERYRKRQGVNKSTANMADILRVLHSTAPPSLPIFVSATLHLPAVNFEHVDISACLQELQIVRQEMKLIRDCSIDSVKVQTELMSLRKEIVDLRNRVNSTPPTVSVPRPSPDNHTATFADVVSVTRPSSSARSLAGKAPPDDVCTQVQGHADGAATAPKSLSGDTAPKRAVAEKAPNPVSTRSSRRSTTGASRDSSDTRDSSSDGFRLVERKRSRPKAVVGTANSTTLTAVKVRPAEIFVTRLDPNTQPKDVERYLNDNLSRKCAISCGRLQTKYDSYSSFRIAVDSSILPEVLSPSFWPCGTLVRRFHGNLRTPSS
ncbi:uncharacterized protein LOC144909982 [Branchiostoma floridae x Branchiostoma belcheri]